jgi:hypothetical protein
MGDEEMKLRWIIVDRPESHLHIIGYKGRCTFCGHRVGRWVWDQALDRLVFVQPIETRKQPWRIPAELWGRYRAMHMGDKLGKLLQQGKCDNPTCEYCYPGFIQKEELR